MDMKLFGKKVNVEGLIAILILLFVIFLFTNSSWMMSKEGFDNNKLTEDGVPLPLVHIVILKKWSLSSYATAVGYAKPAFVS